MHACVNYSEKRGRQVNCVYFAYLLSKAERSKFSQIFLKLLARFFLFFLFCLTTEQNQSSQSNSKVRRELRRDYSDYNS